MTSLFVTGTDTEVGKTQVSAALMGLLKQQGQRVAAMKPIASGCDMKPEGLRNDDALVLNQQANVALAYDVVNPYAFEPAIAPHIAAQQRGIVIDASVIERQFYNIQQQVDSVVVEGAGGWLVPIDTTLTMADVAIRLGLPVVLVVGIRLGCINHALLTVDAIKRSGLPFYGWVANHIVENTESAAIIETLKFRISAPCLGVVPVLSKGQVMMDYLTLVDAAKPYDLNSPK
jgi:dethiobiotin synthetase